MWDVGGGAVGMSGFTEGDWRILGSRNGVDWLVADNAQPGEFMAAINGSVMVTIDRHGNLRQFVIP